MLEVGAIRAALLEGGSHGKLNFEVGHYDTDAVTNNQPI